MCTHSQIPSVNDLYLFSDSFSQLFVTDVKGHFYSVLLILKHNLHAHSESLKGEFNFKTLEDE